MNIFAFSAILAQIIAIRSCSASVPLNARQANVAVYVLSGNSVTGTPYPNYTVNVPEDGVTIPITNPLIVYSISPQDDLTQHPSPAYGQANCTFTLEDGTKAYVTSTYDIIPQKVVSVSCVAAQYPGVTTFASLSPSPTTTTTSTLSSTSPAVSSSSAAVSTPVPPYPTTATVGPSGVPGPTGASASAAPSATGATRGGGKDVVLFTGDAGRAGRPFGGFLVAFPLGIIHYFLLT